MPDPNNLSPDQLAAHELLAELRTRITTQPLPYQYGIEVSALKSIYAEKLKERITGIEESKKRVERNKWVSNLLPSLTE